ncbi:MAG: hypothetical protein L6V93_19600 [Clostridiales bacterium]|nr:MAG: hypothetical protein L6V93_19600 [Clostridiales bacterium]
MIFAVHFLRRKYATLCALALFAIFSLFAVFNRDETAVETGGDYIKMGGFFSITNEAMTKAYKYDVKNRRR